MTRMSYCNPMLLNHKEMNHIAIAMYQGIFFKENLLYHSILV